jgi:hypothetical protein
MKRWIVTLVTALGLAVMAATGAQADPPGSTCITVPELPGECLSAGAYDLIQSQRTDVADLAASNAILSQQLQQTQATFYVKWANAQLRITKMRSKLVELRGTIRSLRAEV